MTLRTRLILTLVGIALLLAGPAIYGASRLAALREIADQQRARHAHSFLALGKLQAALAELDRLERSYIAIAQDDQRLEIERTLTDARQQVTMLKERGYADEAAHISSQLDALDAATRQIVGLVQAGRRDEATSAFEQVKPLMTSAQNGLDRIAGAIDERSSSDIAAAGRISAAGRNTTLIGLGVALIAAVLIGLWTTNAITAPVNRLRHAMAKVANGDFVVPENLPYRRQDEVGDLARSFGSMTQQLEKLDKMKAEFISIATHELKTPINVIGGYAELVEEGVYGPIGDRQAEALHSIRDQSQVLTRLVNQLLDISRLEAGGLHLEMTEVLVRDLFTSLQRSFSILAHKKRIELKVELATDVPATIEADPDRLRDQVLGNLLANALKFTPEGGEIRLRGWTKDGRLHISVSDTGVGIAQDQLQFIFDKFYQIGQQARSVGAGLGLAIAREIVDAHGGEIWVESKENEGTTFCIVLPTRQPEPAQIAPPPNFSSSNGFKASRAGTT